MTYPWARLAQAVDTTVNRQWSERIRIVPWAATDYSAGEPDTLRPTVEAVGELFFEQSTTEPAPREARMVVTDITLSIQVAALRDCDPQQGDHVIALDRGENFEVSYVTNDGTGRAVIHLLRANFP